VGLGVLSRREVTAGGVEIHYLYGIAVKNWSVGGAPLDHSPQGRRVNIADTFFGVRLGKEEYTWVYADTDDQPGIRGQNNPNPQSIFSDGHAVYEISLRGSTVWFDPSYGKTYEGATDLERWRKFMEGVDYVIEGIYTPFGGVKIGADGKIVKDLFIFEPGLRLDLNRNGVLDAAPYLPDKFVHIFRKPPMGVEPSIKREGEHVIGCTLVDVLNPHH